MPTDESTLDFNAVLQASTARLITYNLAEALAFAAEYGFPLYVLPVLGVSESRDASYQPNSAEKAEANSTVHHFLENAFQPYYTHTQKGYIHTREAFDLFLAEVFTMPYGIYLYNQVTH